MSIGHDDVIGVRCAVDARIRQGVVILIAGALKILIVVGMAKTGAFDLQICRRVRRKIHIQVVARVPGASANVRQTRGMKRAKNVSMVATVSGDKARSFVNCWKCSGSSS